MPPLRARSDRALQHPTHRALHAHASRRLVACCFTLTNTRDRFNKPNSQSLTQCNPRTTSATMKPSRMPIAEAPHGSRAVSHLFPPEKAARSCKPWQRTMRHDAAPALLAMCTMRAGGAGGPEFPAGRLLRGARRCHKITHVSMPDNLPVEQQRMRGVNKCALLTSVTRPVLRPHRCRPLVPARLELRLHLTRPPYQLVRRPSRVRPWLPCVPCTPARQACQRGRSVRSFAPAGPVGPGGPEGPMPPGMPAGPCALAGLRAGWAHRAIRSRRPGTPAGPIGPAQHMRARQSASPASSAGHFAGENAQEWC